MLGQQNTKLYILVLGLYDIKKQKLNERLYKTHTESLTGGITMC